MFDTIGAPELLIIGVIVVLLFGVGKVSSLGKELGTSVKEFRRAIRDDETPAAVTAQPLLTEAPPQQYQAPAAQPTTVAAPQDTNRGPQVF